MKYSLPCPNCGFSIDVYRNPIPTVDVIINYSGGVVLIGRKNFPFGWAIPGGFIDYGETAEDAAIREAKEETSLDILDVAQFRVYSAPNRDPRFHTLSVVFIARGEGQLAPADDAVDARVFDRLNLPFPLVFDHSTILQDYFSTY
jgi:ADP-ribose pyrophosphatase YjhB (NUDIX family)